MKKSLVSLFVLMFASFVSADLISPSLGEIVKEDPVPWVVIFGVIAVVIIISFIVLRKIRRPGRVKLEVQAVSDGS